MQTAASRFAPETCELMVFRLGSQEFCIDIMSVRDIRGWTLATILPHSPSYVRGVINLRGLVLPVVDLAARLGFTAIEATARSVIIVTQFEQKSVGLLVDAVSDIVTVAKSDIQKTPDVVSDLAQSFVMGVIAVEGRMISLVGLNNLLPQTVPVEA